MRRRHDGRAIRRVIMNHRSSGRARVDLYLINASLPEVGGINQGSIPWRQHDPPIPSPKIPAAGPRRARKSILSSTSSSKRRSKGRRPQRRLHVLHPSTAIARGPGFGKSPLKLEHGRAAEVRPAPQGRHEARGTPSHSNSTKVECATQEPRLAASLVGPWAESDGGCRTTVRCTSTEPCRHGQPDDRSCAATYT
ncbi:hypothetical protein OIU74_005792 [Salix koriyanagi]|uniref:Uncharacterized protein n=1 Tax=Salix koriyanagi TaxID=2511006 RepID=A0A9Q0NUC1_9ROSI|nr:hypothetical protein OIU74_005792 [Salix koriyanagi]